MLGQGLGVAFGEVFGGSLGGVSLEVEGQPGVAREKGGAGQAAGLPVSTCRGGGRPCFCCAWSPWFHWEAPHTSIGAGGILWRTLIIVIVMAAPGGMFAMRLVLH